jgi:uncharacterized membrane protein YeaQ/YmgE (transglycosylase-associated protein family)
MFRIFILLVIGGLIGWTASLIMKTDKRQGPLIDIAVGVAGAVLAGLATERGAITGDLSFLSLGAALAGAVILLGLVNLIRKGRIR